ncbi:site-2 protease family protein [Mangrovactinospora gilvigrisea]|uniref:Zinc metalloprotease n=1 Tax=Mangrovactinospora gilvigrisea TaxID=1428644 RepID=A0A1J7BIB7_9ACTN|nr:site-2 protease family protein [Mangrovactinospora gilvigrisea]
MSSETPDAPDAPESSAATTGQPTGPTEPGGSRGSFVVARLFGVPVHVGPTWFLVAALITWVFGNQLEWVLPDLGPARYLVSFFFAVAFYASVLVHELAHTIAAIRFELPVRRIHLQFFGGVSEIERDAETPGREFTLAFVGPLLSAVLAVVFWAAGKLAPPASVAGVLLAGLMVSNAIVAAFNLLPGLPLDGGRMLRAVVWKLTRRPMAGTLAAAWFGRVLAVAVLVGLPLATRLRGGIRHTVTDEATDWILAAVLAWVMWSGAGNSIRMARLKERLPGLRARTLARRAQPVPTGTSLAEGLRQAQETGARGLVVVDGAGAPHGIVRESRIVDTPQHRRPWVEVDGLAEEIRPGMRVPADLSGEDLLDALRACPASEYLVVDEDGAVFGVLATSDVDDAFRAAQRA